MSLTSRRATLRERGRKSLPPQFSYEDLKSIITPRLAQTVSQRLEATTAYEVRQKSRKSTRNMLMQAVQRHSVLTHLPPIDLDSFLSELTCFEMGPSEVLFEQGFPASNFYILESGRILLRSNNREIRAISPGECLGCAALIHATQRNHTAVIGEECAFWMCGNDVFQRYISKAKSQLLAKVRKLSMSFPLFSCLSPLQTAQLLDFSIPEHFTSGEKVVYEGESGSVLYFLLEGEAIVRSQGEDLRKLTFGDFFGEQAVLYGGFRTATVVAISDILVLGLDKRYLFSVFSPYLDQFIYLNTMRIALEKNPYLQNLSDLQRERIVDTLRIVTYCYDEVVIQEGTRKGEALYVVLNGSLRARSGLDAQGEKLAVLYSCVGGEAVSQGFEEVFPYDVVADNDEVAIAEISRLDLSECICGDLSEWAAQGRISLKHFRGIPLLEDLPIAKQIIASRAIIVQEYAKSDEICREDTPGEYIYILKSGVVSVSQGEKLVRVVSKHDYFGEKAVLLDKPRTASVVAMEHCVCWLIHKSYVSILFDEVEKNRMVNRVERLDIEINIRDLVPVGRLGVGRLGSVSVVRHQGGALYALKRVAKRKVRTEQIARNLQMERDVLMQVNNRYLVKLVKTLKDADAIYFLTELIYGKPLSDVLRSVGPLNESDARFYFAMFVLGLCYLHERHIVHRDLRPDNVIIEENGYLRIIDLGSAKIINGKAYSMVGCPHYMSPEIVERKGHTAATDLWSLGIVLYEMLCGRVPFGEDETDPVLIFKHVLEDSLTLPPRFECSPSCMDLLTRLLSKDPSSRGFIQDLKQHKWLNSFDWSSLSKTTLTPPYKPKLDPSPQLPDPSSPVPGDILLNEGSSPVLDLSWDSQF